MLSLTREQITALSAGPDLDALVAAYIMGVSPRRGPFPHYSHFSRVELAIHAAETARARGIIDEWRICSPRPNEPLFLFVGRGRWDHTAVTSELPLAVCRGLLLAVKDKQDMEVEGGNAPE